MPGSTTRLALPYPLATEPVSQGDDAIKALADRIEALFTRANGTLAIASNGSGGGVRIVNFAFPTGRFTAPPIVNATVHNVSNNVEVLVNLGSVTATGFTAYFYGVGVQWTLGNIALHWTAEVAV